MYYQNNGTQFLVRGVKYEAPGFTNRKIGDLASFIDPMTDDRICKQDIPYLQNLGINTLFITGYNADRDQISCMQLFSDAGIYVIIMLNTKSEITQQYNGSTGIPSGYTQLPHYFKAIDFFRKWNNTLALGFGLEDLLEPKDSAPRVLPVQKRYIGVVKDYMISRGARSIPIAAFGNEHPAKGFNIPKYMACGAGTTTADLYITRPQCWDLQNWCSNASAHYEQLSSSFQDFPRPVIVSEGCRRGQTSDFGWVQEFYTPKITAMFSGLIYNNWLTKPDGYEIEDDYACPGGLSTCIKQIQYLVLLTCGIVPEGLVNNAHGENLTLSPAYSSLSAQLLSAKPTMALLSSDERQIPIPCEDLNFKKGGGQGNFTRDVTMKPVLPAPPSEQLCRCMMDTITCVSNADSGYESHQKRIKTLMLECNNSSLVQPKHCYGLRIASDEGLFDSYIHCNWTERSSWHYSNYANTSEACTSLDAVAVTPTPTASLDQACRFLLKQARASGTGTVMYFPTGGSFVPESASIQQNQRHLSTGSKIGIGIAISLLLLCGLGGCVIYHRRKEQVGKPTIPSQKAELPGSNGLVSTESGIQLDSNERHELDGSCPVYLEADGGETLAEMAGDFAGVELGDNIHRKG